MGMMSEFKEFAAKGSVLDLAVGVIIGAAFGKIVGSFVSDIIMPVVGLVAGKVDFNNLFINLSDKSYATLEEARKAGAATLNYGTFITTVIDFLIIAFVIFVIVRQANKLKKPAPEVAPTTKDCPYCLSAIPKGATRCGHCTSQLTSAAKA
jgi:large conductance mechanosensitive channel